MTSEELDRRWGAARAQQVILAALGIRRVARVRVDRSQLGDLAADASARGLSVVVGRVSVLSSGAVTSGGYSEWCRVEPVHPSGRVASFVYLARDLRTAEAARRADERNDVRTAGEIYGYPRCCTEWFARRAAWLARRRIDPTFAAFRAAECAPWFMNVSLLRVGYSLLVHVPCGPGCASSAALGREFHAALASAHPARAARLREAMACRVVHSAASEVVAFRTTVNGGSAKICEIVASDGFVLPAVFTVGAQLGVSSDALVVGGVALPRRENALIVFSEEV